MYAVVDVETTGIFPGAHDRVVEVAIVHVSSGGQVQDSWSTLLNPGRDLGPQAIHGIAAADVLGAPTFAAAAGQIASLLSERVLVGQNVSFDARFIQAEFERCGWQVDLVGTNPVCTMRWAPVFLGAGGRLEDCCAHAGVPLDDAHQALSDALATAGLLGHFISACDCQPPWIVHRVTCPPVPGNRIHPVRRGNARSRHRELLAELPTDIAPASPDVVTRYGALVDQALLDGHLSQRELSGLIGAGVAWGISRDQARTVHGDRLRAHRSALRGDAVVEDLASVLGVSTATLDCSPHGPGSCCPLRVGDRVAFTGEMSRPREEYQQLARSAGLIPQDGVTRNLNMLVAADPDSLSGKARKAEQWGIPIVTETAFRRMLDRVGPAATMPAGDHPTEAEAAPRLVRPDSRRTPTASRVERLACQVCGGPFERLFVRGRKPRTCPRCRERVTAP